MAPMKLLILSNNSTVSHSGAIKATSGSSDMDSVKMLCTCFQAAGFDRDWPLYKAVMNLGKVVIVFLNRSEIKINFSIKRL